MIWLALSVAGQWDFLLSIANDLITFLKSLVVLTVVHKASRYVNLGLFPEAV